jgi:hypothetical protein
MIEVRETDVFAAWFAGDREARARITVVSAAFLWPIPAT